MIAILDCIGKTPLVRLSRLSRILGATVFIKLETRNPGGSIWDRLALAYIRGTLERGELSRSGCIVEAADAAFGLSLALVSAQYDGRVFPVFRNSAACLRKCWSQASLRRRWRVSADDAAGARRRLFAMESINAGLETGAALFGALALSRRPEFQNKNIVCIAGEGRNV